MTDRPDYRTHLRQRLVEYDVPESLHAGLVEYFAAHRPTGSFLHAVLENDLTRACLKADPINRYCVADIVAFLFNVGPAKAWGSPEKVAAWLADPSEVAEVFE